MTTPTLRNATEADLADVIEMGRQFYKQSGMATIAPWDEESFRAASLLLIANPARGVLVVAEDDGGIVGMGGCLVFPMFFNTSVHIAQEIFWYVDPHHRDGAGAALIERMETAAKDRGAVALLSGAISGQRDEALARLYRRRGYTPQENTFIKRLIE